MRPVGTDGWSVEQLAEVVTRDSETTHDPWFDDPFPDYDTEPAMAFSRHLKRPAAPECVSRTPCSAAPSLRRQLLSDASTSAAAASGS